MPLVRVEIMKGKSSEYKKSILDGIHSALVEAFKIPEYDRNQMKRKNMNVFCEFVLKLNHCF